MSNNARRLRHLLLLAAACPAVACALTETYAGVLRPEGPEGPMPVVSELRGMDSIVSGKVDADLPLNGKAAITSGENRSGQSDIKAIPNSTVTVRLRGNCRPSLFEGKYTVYYTLRDAESRGSLRLTRASPEAATRIVPPGETATRVTTCQKAHLRCLTACPSSDPNAEFLCTNRCRTKLKTCMGKGDKAH